MTSLAWIHLALFLGLLLLLAWPLSRWLTKVAQGRLPRWMQAVEGLFYRAAGVNPDEDMRWPCCCLTFSGCSWPMACSARSCGCR